MSRVTRASAGNLPSEVNSLVDRRADLAAVRRHVAGSRLVTMTGPGGVGKTRLAIEVARRLQPAFRDGCWLVPLAELTEPQLLEATVVSTIQEGVGVGEVATEFTDVFRDRSLLLVLDNCEHIIQACARLVTRVLRNFPHVKILATSLEPLLVEGELMYRVRPFPVPESPPSATSDLVGANEAVTLFVERARAHNPDFSMSESDMQVVISLCRSLDGLPLAIELAAACSRVLPIDKLRDRAANMFAPQTAGARTAPERHQAVRNMMSYTAQLCSPSARTLWARMSTFRGGADLEAIERVCVSDDLPMERLWTVLAELVDKSVVTLDGGRYRMLELIAHYGQELLTELGEEPVIRRNHQGYVKELVEEFGRGWFGPDQQALMGRVAADEANIRAAISRCLADADSRLGLELASPLWPFWISRSVPDEGRYWLDRLLAISDPGTLTRATALWVNGRLTALGGDCSAALGLLDECQALAMELPDEACFAHAIQIRGLAHLVEGKVGEAVRHLDEAVRLERVLQQPNPYLATALVNLGNALLQLGELDRADDVLGEARTVCAAAGEQLLMSWVLVSLGLAALLNGDLDRADLLAKDALARKRAIGDTLGGSFAVEILGWIACDSNDARRAAVLLGATEARAHAIHANLAGARWLSERHRDYLRQLEEELGTHGVEAAKTQGRLLEARELFDYALGIKSAQPKAALDLPLTPRELEVAHLLATGKTNKEIAGELVIAHRTVDTHVENILTKLDLRSRSQVAALIASIKVQG